MIDNKAGQLCLTWIAQTALTIRVEDVATFDRQEEASRRNIPERISLDPHAHSPMVSKQIVPNCLVVRRIGVNQLGEQVLARVELHISQIDFFVAEAGMDRRADGED